MNQPADAGDSAAAAHNATTNYWLSEATHATTAAAALAAIAPHLKEAALRLATYFAAAAEHQEHHTISPTWVEITQRTGLVPSAIARAIKQLCDPQTNFVTMRAGGCKSASRYQINFLATVRSTSFGEVLQEKFTAQTALPLEKRTATFGEVPPAENAALARAAAASDFDVTTLRMIDHVCCAQGKDLDPDTLTRFRRWMWGYMAKRGQDTAGDPYTHERPPKPPTDNQVAQLLAVADERTIGRMLEYLLQENHQPYSYFWFVATALQRVHGITLETRRRAQAILVDVKRSAKRAAQDAGQVADPDYTQALLFQAARGKKL